MVLETDSRPPIQPDFGFPNTPVTLIPLAEIEIRGTGIEVIAERMAAQHLKDREGPYFVGPAAADRDFAWIGIAGVNPEYQRAVLGIQRAMREARKGNALAPESLDYDFVADSFTGVENPGTQAVLQDFLRTYVETGYEENAGIGEGIIFDDLNRARPDLFEEGDLSSDLEGVSPANVFQLAIEGKLFLPGSGIVYQEPEENPGSQIVSRI